MDFLAQVAMVVSLCAPGNVTPGVNACSERAPHTWASTTAQEAIRDWSACKALARAYVGKPGETARCEYSEPNAAA